MSKREKLIAKICSGSQVSFNEAKDLLVNLGFSFRQSGSHATFNRGDLRITLVAGGDLKPAYKEQLCQLLRRAGH